MGVTRIYWVSRKWKRIYFSFHVGHTHIWVETALLVLSGQIVSVHTYVHYYVVDYLICNGFDLELKEKCRPAQCRAIPHSVCNDFINYYSAAFLNIQITQANE